jgi:chromosome segregation ATPase
MSLTLSLQLNARLEEQLLTIEEHQASLADARSRIEAVEAEGATLQSAVARREERIDELLAEQQRADNEVGTLQTENQRLTKENLEAERARREADRRLEEQVGAAASAWNRLRASN